MMELAGIPRPFLSVSGTCQGVELHLDAKTVSFGPVVHGTTVTKRVLLFNTGDVGVKFQWDTTPLGTDFTLQPAEGFVQAHNDVAIELTYHPATVMKTSVIEGLCCRIQDAGAEPLLLNVNGQCVDVPPVSEVLKFQTTVRKAQVKQIKLNNPTGSLWRLRPQVDSESWLLQPQVLEIKPQETASLDISYLPTVCSKNRPPAPGAPGAAPGTASSDTSVAPEKAMLFIPLPTGVAKLYQLEGIADPPTAVADYSREVQCKVLHTEKVVVANWLKRPQRFRVTRSFGTSEAVIKGLDEIDVPPQASRDYKFTFLSYKESVTKGTVTFTNEETKEYLFYNFTFKALPPAIVETIALRAPIRQKAVHTLTIENPLTNRPITLTSKCDSADITLVPPTLTIGPATEGTVSVVYFPLVMRPQELTAKLSHSCAELGEFPYLLKLSTTSPAPEKFVRFQCALGGSQTQTLRFVHFARQATEFACKFQDPKGGVFTKTNGQAVIKVPAV
eukprot:RCo013451